MRDPRGPAAQRLPGGFLDDGQFVIVSGEAADSVQAGEERDRGEHDLRAIVPAQQAGTAKAADCAQVPADLSFVVTLIVIGGGQRRPSTPYARDHLSSRRSRRSDIPDGTVTYQGMGGSEHPADTAICRDRVSGRLRLSPRPRGRFVMPLVARDDSLLAVIDLQPRF